MEDARGDVYGAGRPFKDALNLVHTSVAAEVQCILPETPSAADSLSSSFTWNISLSNDNKTLAKMIPVYVQHEMSRLC